VNISTIRTELAAAIDNITGLRVSSFMPDKLSVPAAVVEVESIDLDKTHGNNLHELVFKIRVYASRATDRSGQAKLDGYLAGSGSGSIRAALETARGVPGAQALNGAAEDLRLTGVDGYGVYRVGETDYYGAELSVTVWARGT
jgi:hypothetical protein